MKRLLLIIFIIYHHTSFAQEMWGIANSNFAASSGMSLNPTSMMLMPYKWEVTLISGNISLQNNYVAFARDKATTTAEGTPDPHRGVIDYYHPGDKSANAHIMINVPSFTFRMPNNMAFGFHSGVRMDLSVRNVPAELAKFGYEGVVYNPLHGSSVDLTGIRVGEMAWAEAGISAAKLINRNPEKKWFAGATLKYILGLEAIYFKSTNGSMDIRNDSTVQLNDFSGTLNTALPNSSYQMLSFPNRGIGVDLGVCYVSNSNLERFENGRPVLIKKYDYRVGISLIDLGFVTFKQYAKLYDFNSNTASFNGTGNGVDSMIDANQRQGTITMSLPTALSVQYDRCLKPKLFLNLSAIQRIPLPMPHIDRPNQLSATLRYETTFFEVAVPYSFYDYYLHRIGLAARYGILYLGTDKIGTFINNKEISGVDFYFGLRINNFDFIGRPKAKKKTACATIF